MRGVATGQMHPSAGAFAGRAFHRRSGALVGVRIEDRVRTDIASRRASGILVLRTVFGAQRTGGGRRARRCRCRGWRRDCRRRSARRRSARRRSARRRNAGRRSAGRGRTGCRCGLVGRARPGKRDDNRTEQDWQQAHHVHQASCRHEKARRARTPGFPVVELGLRSPCHPCHRSGRPRVRRPSPACRRRRPRWSGTAPRWMPRSAAPSG